MSEWTDLKNASASWSVPPDDFTGVRERARVLIRRRRIVTSGVSILLILAVVGVALAWPRSDDNFRVQPAGGTIGGARAATFAFHALLRTTDLVDPEIGHYDYKAVDQTDVDEWRVNFDVGPDPDEIAQTLESRRAMLDELEESKRGLGPRAELGLSKDIRKLQEAYEDAVSLGGPFNVALTVQKVGEMLQIAQVEGPMMEDIRTALLAFEESVNQIPAQGTEHLRVRVGRGEGRYLSLTVGTWWTGPIPSPYRETCLLSLIDKDGKTVYTERPGASPHSLVESAPHEEEQRDWGYGRSGGRIPDRLEGLKGLRGVINCNPVNGEGWVAVGDAAIEPVTEEFSIGSAELLNPESHVMVSTKIVYQGEPGIESICIARVFDESGQEISSHGLTYNEEEHELLFGENAPIKIPVDVGDPDNADFATVNCQPTVPGVNLGPDQAD
jgi:hypothetical protein